MSAATRRGAQEGIGAGLIAGVIFAVMQVVGAAVMGHPPLMPFRMFASVVLGRDAMSSTPPGTAFVVGAIAHLVLSAIFGLIYAAINSRFSTETQTQWGRQAGLGLLAGVVLWFVNFQILGRLLYPWFLASPQPAQLVMHAVFFGLPLGLMYAGAKRRARPVGRAPTAA
jgi:hypothetical protein